ncbi:hypothetical protein NW762_000144 [Fusarium torreyae]|uniref:Uncharacterized protein n=1 Tax=Fusarium torreyae TaxID=1237075 RepID=A0A9W8SIU9_9HYPO|nr:hypothetical protein NW762_000144 [Fusarium torreyae]
MEPPTKKRHRESSARKAAQDEDEDDDELASHPQELLVRRDPNIQLALKRANADHKLQATMAHIIEKYSRDFEGIGDEIDMETGEIVVNNGHLRSMRDEGDVEGLWMEGDSNIDQDEGILLEDLTDEYSDNEGLVNEVRDSRSDDGTNHSKRDQETHASSEKENKATDQASEIASSVATRMSKTPHDQDERLPSDLHHNRQVIDDPQFGPLSFGPGAPSGFGPPPPGFGPWGMMPRFPMQAWGRDDIPPYFNMSPSMPGPWFTPGRYNFPINSGQTSIWGRSHTKKTKRAGSMKGSSKRATNIPPTDASVNEKAGIAEGNVKISSKEQQPHGQEFPASDRTINATDEDDDLVFSGTTNPTPTKLSPIPPAKGTLTNANATQQHTPKVLKETTGNITKLPHQSDENDDSGRRRSGRARKQTEYMGKISWNDAREWQKSAQTMSVELYRADTSMREGFQSVDNTDDERLPSQAETQGNVPTSKEAEAEESPQRHVVPDSQDTATPFNSSAPQSSPPKENISRQSTFNHPIVPAMELSDDEAPLVLSRIKAPKLRIEALDVDPQLPVEPLQEQNQTDDAVASAVRSPPKTTQTTRRIESRVVEVLDKAVQSLKRKRGRPKGSTNKPKEVASKEVTPITTIVVSPDGGSEPQKRKRGRPRKSDIAIQNNQAEVQDHQDEVTHNDEGPSHCEAPQQESADESPATEEPETSHYLSHELRWLHKTKPKSKGHATNDAQDIDLDTQLGLWRSTEKLQPIKDTTEEPDEIMEEPQDASPEDVTPEEQPTRQKSQDTMQATDIIMEEPMETSNDPEVVEDDEPSSPTIHASLPDDVSSSDNDLPPIHDESLDNYEHSNEYRPPEEAKPSEEDGPPEEQPPTDADSLPSPPQDIIIQQVSTPRKPKDTIAHSMEPPSSSHKLHTPRHTSIRTTRAPSSRRSLLSFVSDSESDTDGSRDELTRKVKSASKTRSARPSTHKVWRATTLTREVHKTPSRRRVQEMSSPISTIKTPGGTVRTCGVDGYHCGRDYCFSCF